MNRRGADIEIICGFRDVARARARHRSRAAELLLGGSLGAGDDALGAEQQQVVVEPLGVLALGGGGGGRADVAEVVGAGDVGGCYAEVVLVAVVGGFALEGAVFVRGAAGMALGMSLALALAGLVGLKGWEELFVLFEYRSGHCVIWLGIVGRLPECPMLYLVLRRLPLAQCYSCFSLCNVIYSLHSRVSKVMKEGF